MRKGNKRAVGAKKKTMHAEATNRFSFTGFKLPKLGGSNKEAKDPKNKPESGRTKPILSKPSLSRNRLIAFFLLFGIIGAFIIYKSFAAGPTMRVVGAAVSTLRRRLILAHLPTHRPVLRETVTPMVMSTSSTCLYCLATTAATIRTPTLTLTA